MVSMGCCWDWQGRAGKARLTKCSVARIGANLARRFEKSEQFLSATLKKSRYLLQLDIYAQTMKSM